VCNEGRTIGADARSNRRERNHAVTADNPYFRKRCHAFETPDCAAIAPKSVSARTALLNRGRSGHARRTSGAEDRPPQAPCKPFQRDASEMRIARRIEARRPHGNRGVAGCDGQDAAVAVRSKRPVSSSSTPTTEVLVSDCERTRHKGKSGNFPTVDSTALTWPSLTGDANAAQ
jgi:hypothetical protein